MIFYKKCPICNSDKLKGYAIDCIRNGPHMSRVKCYNCKIVFANPMADANELDLFYSGYYNKGNFGLLNYFKSTLEQKEKVKRLNDKALAREADYIYKYVQGGRFLDVGCGLGAGLTYVDRPEFELYATELDAEALSFVHQNYSKVKTFKGELLDAAYPDNFFDYIYCNHLIEHVLDPVGYINEMLRILKKGGILYIGTPDRGGFLYRAYRFYKFLTLSVPQIIDGIEHTFIFSKRNLADLVTREGFIIESQKSYPLRVSFNSIFQSDMTLRKKLARYGQTFFNINQEIICKK